MTIPFNTLLMRKTNINSPKKIALVCSGGFTKAGAFHMGVCLALEEKGFIFKGGPIKKQKKESTNNQSNKKNRVIDTYVGSSAGSLISNYLAAGYSIDDIFNAYIGKNEKSKLSPIKYSNLLSIKSSSHEDKAPVFAISRKLKGVTDYAVNFLYNRKLITLPGVFTTAGLESYVRETLSSNSFKDYAADLYIVATQLNHSRRVIFCKKKLPTPEDDHTCMYNTETSISDAVAASAALPPIFAPYGIRDKKKDKVIYYFDGEIRETLSVHVAEDAGAELIFASYTHQPYHYNREIGSLTNFGVPAIAIQAIYLLVERKIQSSIYARNKKLAAIDAVSEYCKAENIGEKQRKKLCSILENTLAVKKKVKHIYIHPRSTDHQMFFGEHFSLTKKSMEKYVNFGFRAAIDTLRQYNF